MTCFGQFKPIVTGDSISWDLKHEIFDGAMMENLVLGDTISIDSITYHNVNLNGALLGYFREDTMSGKAWFWGATDTTEYLIMDLSLNINDTFLVKMYADTNVTVSSIDIINGRKTLTLNYHYGGGFISEDLKFIEGVGPNAALFYQLDDNYYDYFGYLVCKMFHDTTIVYAWDTINFECGSFVGIEEKHQNKKYNVEVYPNPTKSIVKFVLKDHSLLNKSIVIYNIHGQKLMQKRFDKTEIEINLERFSNQTFIYSIIGTKSQTIGKILKE